MGKASRDAFPISRGTELPSKGRFSFSFSWARHFAGVDVVQVWQVHREGPPLLSLRGATLEKPPRDSSFAKARRSAEPGNKSRAVDPVIRKKAKHWYIALAQ